MNTWKNWKDVKGYEGLYKISSTGEIWSEYKHKIKTSNLQNSGYLIVWLLKDHKRKAKLVHRLVAETFIENPQELKEVNHIDGDKTNNSVENLEWISRSDNLRHRAKVLKQRGNAVKVICLNTGKEFDAIKDAAEWANVTPGAIQQNLNGTHKTAGGYSWKRK